MQVKMTPSILMLLFFITIYSQEATEIYLFDLLKSDNTYRLSNPINISDHAGYDNQPQFTLDGTGVLFSSFRDGQADIALYDINQKVRAWLTETEGNEFSPSSFPKKKKNFTCIRLDEDGSQLLFKYSYKNKEPEVLIPNLQVGYYSWINDKMLVSFVLGDVETLQVSNFKYKLRYPIEQNIGRSFQKIPNTELVAFISKSHETPEIYSINPNNSTSTYIVDPIEGSDDMVWTNDGTIFMAKDDNIFKYKPHQDEQWTPIKIESEYLIMNITRMAISPDGTKIAIVVDEILVD